MRASVRLADMHCHLDFADDAAELARQAAASGVAAFSNTVTPGSFLAARAELAGQANVRVGLGLHPWWVGAEASGAEQADLFCSLAAEERFIGEVGLDFSAARVATRQAQLAAFDRVLQACAKNKGLSRVISIHAVRSASAALDAIERQRVLQSGSACVFHWFSGSGDELGRAARLGCFFSVGTRMLATKRGRAYARSVPESRLLLETDLPAAQGSRLEAGSWLGDLEGALEGVAQARGCDPESLRETIARTSAELLGL